MLSEPRHGWTTISIGKKDIGTASYLTDVPVDCLEKFISYFSQKESENFHIEFDAEGHEFGIIEFGNTLFAVDNATNDTTLNVAELEPKLLGLETYESNRDMLLFLAMELIVDIYTYFDLWVNWDVFDEDSEEEKRKRKTKLKALCIRLEHLIEGEQRKSAK